MPNPRDTSNDVNMSKEALRQWMQTHGYSPDSLAEALGVTRQAVIYWMQGKRDIPEPIGRLLNFFDIRPGLLKEF